jgi:hypothetical protein
MSDTAQISQSSVLRGSVLRGAIVVCKRRKIITSTISYWARMFNGEIGAIERRAAGYPSLAAFDGHKVGEELQGHDLGNGQQVLVRNS